MIEIEINNCKSSIGGISIGRTLPRERGNKNTGGEGTVCAYIEILSDGLCKENESHGRKWGSDGLVEQIM